MLTDLELLNRYVCEHSEEAFAELTRPHVNLVYSAALRQVRTPQLAEEVVQLAFMKLAANAQRLKQTTIVSAWLYQVARREAVDMIRREARRHKREQAAQINNMDAGPSSDWTHVEPFLDEAMAALAETDRTVILLRFFENKSLREIGNALGTSEDEWVNSWRESLRRFYGSAAPVKVVRPTDERCGQGFVLAAPPLRVLAEPGSLAIRISRRDLWPRKTIFPTPPPIRQER
jgi:RNA polymerase sigma factor (sigma-70 family)